ncbi:MAG TPA: hypothetical protein VNV85_03895 [Puia sp.]|jgi:hypothetical protein|nr:hypothetical protein [Puia sp.]
MQANQSRKRIVPLFKGKRKISRPDDKEHVELFEGRSDAPPANAQLTYNGGALIQNVEVYTLFWGNSWSADAAMISTMNNINQFFNDILVSPLLDQLSEYNVAGQYTIGYGKLVGTQVIVLGSPQPGSTIDDTTIQSTIQNWVASGALPTPDANSLYFIYLDNQVKVTMGGGASCTDFCGYHDAINNNLYYAVMPYPSCYGCLGGLQPIDALTGTSSHELCEAITDPAPPSGWYDNANNMEIGDICAWTFKTVAGHNVQNEWSNAAKGCI